MHDAALDLDLLGRGLERVRATVEPVLGRARGAGAVAARDPLQVRGHFRVRDLGAIGELVLVVALESAEPDAEELRDRGLTQADADPVADKALLGLGDDVRLLAAVALDRHRHRRARTRDRRGP